MFFPPEILKKIFSYQTEWWLSNPCRLIYIPELSRIPRPVQMLVANFDVYVKVELKFPSSQIFRLVYCETGSKKYVASQYFINDCLFGRFIYLE
jgi:hypothetical protein